MRAFVVFCKKEFTESVRTYKFAVLLAVFAILGVMSPMLAKMMPEILGSVEIEGMVITVPPPAAMDYWAQFFKNVGQIGMLALIVVFSGIMSGEFSRGTLINLLTKGLRRGTVITAKFAAAAVIWTIAYALCLGLTLAYTAYYAEIDVQNAVLAFGGLWLFGEFLTALLIFGGTLFKNVYGSLLSAFAVIIALSVVSAAPQAAKYNPVSLSGGTLALLDGSLGAEDFIPAVIITAVSAAALLAASVAVFRRKNV